MIGLRVGPFEIVETADVPEPGSWYYARRSGMSQRKPSEVLVRVLDPDADAASRQELQRAFENLRQVEHARVPIAVAMYEGVGAMAITAVRGTSLAPVVAARSSDDVPMSPATLLDLLLEIAEILQFAHHRGRPHGHLEPRHLVIAADGTVWVMGYAAGAQASPDATWIAPERARGEQATEATDQWSLAALGSALITGKAPWGGTDPLAAAKSGDLEHLVAPVEQQWPALARLLRKMLDSRPANRFPTMHQVRQELLALARKAGGTSARRELGAELNNAASLVETEAGAPARTTPPPPGDTLTPPEALDPEEDALEEHEEDSRPTLPPGPVLQPEVEFDVEVEVDFEDLEPEVEVEVVVEDRSSEPEIQVARSIEARSGKPRSATPLPAEQIPVVRPDLDGETFGSGGPSGYSDPGSSAFDTVPRPRIHDVSVVDPSDVDSALNVRPHPDHDPKSVADPPSMPLDLMRNDMPSSEEDEEDAADYEATVLYTAAHLESQLEEQGGYAMSDSTGEVEVQVEYTDESELPSPTLSPTTDSDMVSEEIPRPRPQAVPTHPGAKAKPKTQDDGFPSRVPDSVGHEPELGSVLGDVSIRNEPVLGGADEDFGRPSEIPAPASSTPQQIAMVAIGALVLAMLIWTATQLFG